MAWQYRRLRGHTPGVVNIGTGERTTLKRLVALLEVLLQRKAETDSCPGDRLDPPGTHASIEKARALGYRPRVELMNGLRELLAQEQPSVVL